MRHFVLVATLLLSTRPAVADVVSIYGEGAAEILYRSGTFVEKAWCEEGATIRRRTSCSREPHRVDAVFLYDYILRTVGQDLPELEQALGETQANLAETDAKLLEYLASDTGTPDDARDLAEIARVEGEAADLAVSVVGLKDQIARIKARPDYRTSPDLPRQVATLERQLTEATKAREDRLDELNALRAAYVEARAGGHSQAAFQLLRRQRASQAQNYETLRNRSDDVLEALVRMNQYLTELVEDQAFAFEIRVGDPFYHEARDVLRLFDQASKPSGVIYSQYTEQGIELVVPHMTGHDQDGRFADYASKLQWIRCRFQPAQRSCTALEARRVGRDGRWDMPMAFDLLKGQAGGELGDFEHAVFPHDASGNWVFEPICRSSSSDRRGLGLGWCELGFVYERIR